MPTVPKQRQSVNFKDQNRKYSLWLLLVVAAAILLLLVLISEFIPLSQTFQFIIALSALVPIVSVLVQAFQDNSRLIDLLRSSIHRFQNHSETALSDIWLPPAVLPAIKDEEFKHENVIVQPDLKTRIRNIDASSIIRIRIMEEPLS